MYGVSSRAMAMSALSTEVCDTILDPVQALRSSVEGDDALSFGVAQGIVEESGRDLDGGVRIRGFGSHHHGSIEHGRDARTLEQEGSGEPIVRPRAPAGRHRRCGRKPRAHESEEVPAILSGSGKGSIREPLRIATSCQAPFP